jgi:hypothetical protein
MADVGPLLLKTGLIISSTQHFPVRLMAVRLDGVLI